jgi:hypothetical protein
MTIDWLYAQTITGNIEFPRIWTLGGVLISISNSAAPTWRKLGYLKIEASIAGEFFTAQYKPIEFGNSLLPIPYSNYRLSFEPVERLIELHPNLTIKIAEFNLNMYVSPAPSSRPEVGEPIYTTVTPNQANATVPVFTIVAPRSRRSALVTNKTNKPVYIKEGAAASAPTLVPADPFVSIAAGSSYTVEDWSGEIVGLMSANYQAGGKIIVKELPYVGESSPAPAA